MTVLDSFVIGENKVHVPCGVLESTGRTGSHH